jgi:hypothetical protein
LPIVSRSAFVTAMMRRASLFLLAFAFACTPPASRAIARLTAASEVRLAERQRFEAMVERDVVALDTLLDDEMSYVRAGGGLQSRPEFMNAIEKQKVVYESITPSKVRVRVFEGLALATGRSEMRVRDAVGVRTFQLRFTELYVRRDGHWLLTAWESKRLKPLSEPTAPR